jgi:hypothetical protein
MVAKRKRWVCPLCEVGVLGPLRPRKDNAVRYCLPCTEKTGKLKERVAPASLKNKERKAQQKEEAKERKAEKQKENPKPRNTKRSWMQDPRYVFSYEDRAYNIMEMAEKMCGSARWDSVVKNAAKKTQATLYTCTANRTMKRLWDRTVQGKGAQGNRGALRISRTSKSYSTGRGGNGYGVTMSATPHNVGDTMTTLLHEFVHVAHLSQVSAARINDKRRPHDLMFNIIQWQMAKNFWGYDFSPHIAGWSVGRGYAPTRHLSSWLNEQIKSGNPKVMRWFTMEAPPEKEKKKGKTRPPNWEITKLSDTLVRVRFTPGLMSVFDYIMECPEDEDRVGLREAIDNATKKGKECLVDMEEPLLDTLTNELEHAQSFNSVLNEPSEYKGTARTMYAIQKWKEGVRWCARGASYSANFYWGNPCWTGGLEEPSE